MTTTEDLLSVFKVLNWEMQEQIRLSCQRDAFHQTINTEFERERILSVLATSAM